MANCKTCLHAAVCSRRIATGGLVKKCEHFREKRQGRWEIFVVGFGCELMCCSVCKSEFYDGYNDTVDHPHNYCPHCGADMRGKTYEN